MSLHPTNLLLKRLFNFPFNKTKYATNVPQPKIFLNLFSVSIDWIQTQKTHISTWCDTGCVTVYPSLIKFAIIYSKLIRAFPLVHFSLILFCTEKKTFIPCHYTITNSLVSIAIHRAATKNRNKKKVFL